MVGLNKQFQIQVLWKSYVVLIHWDFFVYNKQKTRSFSYEIDNENSRGISWNDVMATNLPFSWEYLINEKWPAQKKQKND